MFPPSPDAHPSPSLANGRPVRTSLSRANDPAGKAGPDASVGPRLRIKALCVLDDESHGTVFGPSEWADLGAAVEWAGLRLQPDEFASGRINFQNVEALFTGWGSPLLDAALLDRLPRLRILFHVAGSVRNVVTDDLWARGIRVTTAAAMNAIPVAEYTLSQVIFCLKHGWQRVFEVKARTHYRKHTDLMPGAYESTVGLLSLGHTGRLVARMLRPFDVRVLAYDPLATPADARELGLELCTLEEIFRRCDVVSCHTPLLPETSRMLRGGHFASMRPGATFINTARGGVVHEPEMIETLQARPDLFAVLDVSWQEPPEEGSPLYNLPNVVITPHIAGSLGREGRRMGRMIVEEVTRYLRGEPLQGEVLQEQTLYLA